jgi:hypothetical protein
MFRTINPINPKGVASAINIEYNSSIIHIGQDTDYIILEAGNVKEIIRALMQAYDELTGEKIKLEEIKND